MNLNCQGRSPSPMVSVVMIAYNKEKYIAQAIKGVVMQKVPFPIELIVMDDCSTDATPSVIEGWVKRYPGVVINVRNKVNLGLQRNYLEGFSRCRGRYIAVCDADDYWFCRRKLARQVKYMETHPDCAVTFHRVVNYYEETGEKSLSNGSQARDCDIADLSEMNFITNLSVMYRREVLDVNNFPAWMAEVSSPDYAFHMLFAAHGSIHFLKRPMGVYRKSSQGIWSNASDFGRLSMSLRVRLDLMDEFRDNVRVTSGLRKASEKILRAMAGCVADEAGRQYFETCCRKLSLDIKLPEERVVCSDTVKRPAVARKRPLKTRLRAAVSRLLPVPRP